MEDQLTLLLVATLALLAGVALSQLPALHTTIARFFPTPTTRRHARTRAQNPAAPTNDLALPLLAADATRAAAAAAPPYRPGGGGGGSPEARPSPPPPPPTSLCAGRSAPAPPRPRRVDLLAL